MRNWSYTKTIILKGQSWHWCDFTKHKTISHINWQTACPYVCVELLLRLEVLQWSQKHLLKILLDLKGSFCFQKVNLNRGLVPFIFSYEEIKKIYKEFVKRNKQKKAIKKIAQAYKNTNTEVHTPESLWLPNLKEINHQNTGHDIPS